MQTNIEVLLRSVVAIVSLLLIARLLGKQTISNMTFNDFVTSITLGSVAANLAFNESIKWLYFIISLCVITALSYLFSLIAIKSQKMRKWISGSPTVLIEGGKILEDNMKKIRYTLDSLDQALRGKDIFNIEEVEYAVLEDNGMLSVLKKEQYRSITKKDIKLPYTTQNFPVELIMDGTVVEKNLKDHGLTSEWLEKELKQRGKRVADVFYAVRGTQQELFFDFYEDRIGKPVNKE